MNFHAILQLINESMDNEGGAAAFRNRTAQKVRDIAEPFACERTERHAKRNPPRSLPLIFEKVS
jgi:hypothetical protein